MHATYYRPGGVYRDLPDEMPKVAESRWSIVKDLERINKWRQGTMLDFIEAFADDFFDRLDEYHVLLTNNRIGKQRTVGIGVVEPDRALQMGYTGAMLRGSGVEWDLRKKQPTPSTPRWTLIFRSASRATVTTAIWCAWKRCASRPKSSSSAWPGCAKTKAPSSCAISRLRRPRAKK